MTVILRPGTARDHGYCHATWLDSWRAEAFPWTSAAAFRETMGSEVASRIRRGKLVVACDIDDSDRLYGWAVGKPGRLWWVYVRDTRRRMGLATRLVREACGETKGCLAMTPATAPIAARKGILWVA